MYNYNVSLLYSIKLCLYDGPIFPARVLHLMILKSILFKGKLLVLAGLVSNYSCDAGIECLIAHKYLWLIVLRL